MAERPALRLVAFTFSIQHSAISIFSIT